jgi:hypothetical protein
LGVIYRCRDMETFKTKVEIQKRLTDTSAKRAKSKELVGHLPHSSVPSCPEEAEAPRSESSWCWRRMGGRTIPGPRMRTHENRRATP